MTGPEIAALVEEGCLIGSAADFSEELEHQISGLPAAVRNHRVVCRNWIRGVFLIVKVVQDRDSQDRHLHLTDADDVAAFLEKLEEDAASIYLRGRKYRVSPSEGTWGGDYKAASPAARRAAIRSLEAPFLVTLTPESEPDCGEDGVLAVNLTRSLDLIDPSCPQSLASNIRAKVASAGHMDDVAEKFQLQHYIGGPCEGSDVAATIVANSTTRKFHVLSGCHCLEQALALARNESDREAREQVDATCESKASQPASTTSERANKRQRLDHESLSRDTAADDLEEPAVQVKVFWGYAGWSRCQLMGEIARGSWGLCQFQDGDLTDRNSWSDLWRSVYSRLIFAPKNEMSETYNQEMPDEAARLRQLRRMALFQLLLRRNGAARPRSPGLDLEAGASSSDESGEEDSAEEAQIEEDLLAEDLLNEIE